MTIKGGLKLQSYSVYNSTYINKNSHLSSLQILSNMKGFLLFFSLTQDR